MESPGKHLKRERELRKLTLREVSASTRIKETILAAIEEDRFDLCPPAFYVKGFLTSYARHLGMDPASVLSEYQELVKPPAPSPAPEIQERPQALFPIRFRIQGQPALRFLLVSLLWVSLLAPLYFYYAFRSENPSGLAALDQRRPAVSRESNNPSGHMPAQSATAEVIPESLQETDAVPVVTEKSKPPVFQQIKQLELIGPKEVQAESFPKVVEAHLGTGIELEGGRPLVVGKGSDFRCENQRIYFFTRIMTAAEGKILHVWQREGEELHRIEMNVKPPAWSVYSYITLPPGRLGQWHAEVRDGDRVLTRQSFKAH